MASAQKQGYCCRWEDRKVGYIGQFSLHIVYEEKSLELKTIFEHRILY